MKPSERYSLVPPVEGGEQYWLINDRVTQITLVSISVNYPLAAMRATALHHVLTCPDCIKNNKSV